MANVKTANVEVWVLVDADGDYVAVDDRDTALERYEECFGGYSDAGAVRWVKVTLSVPLPVVVNVSATIGEEKTDVGVKVE